MPHDMELVLDERFAGELGACWCRTEVRQASVRLMDGVLRLARAGATAEQYANAQIDDYRERPRRRFPWRPPLTLTVRARFSHPGWSGRCGRQGYGDMADREAPDRPGNTEYLQGTAGFGFWNDPLMLHRMPPLVAPQAIWFFYGSPPSDMKIDPATPGCGWKAATMDAARLPFFALLPTAPLAMPLMHSRRLYHQLWPVAQRAIRASERQLDVQMTAWHTYTIFWGTHRAEFGVDDRPVFRCETPPHGPLGLVIWLDNQFLSVAPWGQFRYGFLRAPGEQWLELERVTVAVGGE